MSNSNLSSRTAPKIRLSDNPEEDFNFYMQFVTPLVSKLIEEKERKLAVEWIKKLTDDKRNPGLRTEYLLLLFFALQRRHLSGPFQSSPSQTECLQPFENNLDMFQMMERMVKEKRKPTMNPPYYSEVSGDFKEYVVTQEIPNFGVHCYMATSNEPLQKWKNSHLANIPKEPASAESKPSQINNNSISDSASWNGSDQQGYLQMAQRSTSTTPSLRRETGTTSSQRSTELRSNGKQSRDYSVNLDAIDRRYRRSSCRGSLIWKDLVFTSTLSENNHRSLSSEEAEPHTQLVTHYPFLSKQSSVSSFTKSAQRESPRAAGRTFSPPPEHWRTMAHEFASPDQSVQSVRSSSIGSLDAWSSFQKRESRDSSELNVGERSAAKRDMYMIAPEIRDGGKPIVGSTGTTDRQIYTTASISSGINRPDVGNRSTTNRQTLGKAPDNRDNSQPDMRNTKVSDHRTSISSGINQPDVGNRSTTNRQTSGVALDNRGKSQPNMRNTRVSDRRTSISTGINQPDIGSRSATNRQTSNAAPGTADDSQRNVVKRSPDDRGTITHGSNSSQGSMLALLRKSTPKSSLETLTEASLERLIAEYEEKLNSIYSSNHNIQVGPSIVQDSQEKPNFLDQAARVARLSRGYKSPSPGLNRYFT